jgi:hypothetical protein
MRISASIAEANSWPAILDGQEGPPTAQDLLAVVLDWRYRPAGDDTSPDRLCFHFRDGGREFTTEGTEKHRGNAAREFIAV